MNTEPEPMRSDADLVPLAREGNRECASQLLWTSARTLRRGEPLDSVVAVYLADALDEVAEFLAYHPDDPPGEAFAAAFHFPKRKGRRSSWRTERQDILIATWVRLAVQDRGLTKAEAKLAAAALFGIENIDRALRRVATSYVASNAATFDAFFKKQGKPLPDKKSRRK